MRENITKVAERGERLDALQDKTGEFGFPARSSLLTAYYTADNLAQSAQGFRKGANRVRKQMVSSAALWSFRSSLLTSVRASRSGGAFTDSLDAVLGAEDALNALQEGHEDANPDRRRHSCLGHYHRRQVHCALRRILQNAVHPTLTFVGPYSPHRRQEVRFGAR